MMCTPPRAEPSSHHPGHSGLLNTKHLWILRSEQMHSTSRHHWNCPARALTSVGANLDDLRLGRVTDKEVLHEVGGEDVGD